jgi:hypothetical protein
MAGAKRRRLDDSSLGAAGNATGGALNASARPKRPRRSRQDDGDVLGFLDEAYEVENLAEDEDGEPNGTLDAGYWCLVL